MLKKLEIAHMLDAYEEEEFVPEEENLVDPQRVRAAVMGRSCPWRMDACGLSQTASGWTLQTGSMRRRRISMPGRMDRGTEAA